MSMDYVHGYSAAENTRLTDQATTLSELLHADTLWSLDNLEGEAVR